MAKGDVIYTIHGDEPELFQEAEEHLVPTFRITDQQVDDHQLIKKVLT